MQAVKETLERPLWEGGKTLALGELVAFVIALALIFWMGKVSFKSLWVWVGLIVILVAMIIW